MSCYLDGFTDLSSVPVVFFAQDLDIVHGAIVACVGEVVFNSRIDSLSDGMLFESCFKVPPSLSDVILWTVLTFNVVNYSTLIFLLCFVLGFY